jgi:hypothetical protein
MTKKQKKVLIRIIIAAVLVIALQFIPVKGYVRFGLYMIPYFVIGYDILKKAGKGILNRQIFDENFLMAVATIGAIALGDYKEGTAVMIFIKAFHRHFHPAVRIPGNTQTSLRYRLIIQIAVHPYTFLVLKAKRSVRRQLIIKSPMSAYTPIFQPPVRKR